MTMMKCGHCGAAFEAQRAHARYCSVNCRVNAYNARHKPVAPAPAPKAKPTFNESDKRLREQVKALEAEVERLRTATSGGDDSAAMWRKKAMQAGLELAHLREENERLTKALHKAAHAVSGASTRTVEWSGTTYNLIRSVLHPDHQPPAMKERADKAFNAFTACVKRPTKD
jgi:hypothetical protein